MLRNEIAIMRALQGLLPRMLYCAAERGGLDEAIKAAVEIEEAARREAEAKELGRTVDDGGLIPPQGEREGPGSAAAPKPFPYYDDNGHPVNDAARAERVTKGSVVLSKEVVAFLCGEAPLDGLWFGEVAEQNPRGKFWWRRLLRAKGRK